MSYAAHVAWATGTAGAHSVSVEWRGSTGAWVAIDPLLNGTAQCLAGWNTSGSFLSVEEIP